MGEGLRLSWEGGGGKELGKKGIVPSLTPPLSSQRERLLITLSLSPVSVGHLLDQTFCGIGWDSDQDLDLGWGGSWKGPDALLEIQASTS